MGSSSSLDFKKSNAHLLGLGCLLACLLVFFLAVVVGCVMKLRPSSHTLISNDPVFTWRSRFDKMPRLLSYLAFAIYAASLAACPRFNYAVNRTPRLNY